MQESPSVKIVIATHKAYQMPEDEMYIPLQVGAEGKEDIGFRKDNTGENISMLNAGFCELTGLYWAWKNLSSDYIGLVHYRRHFGIRRSKDPWKCILTYKDIEPFLGRIKVFVPNKRKYYIETIYNHYKHTHYAEQLDEAGKVISEKYPEYLGNYDKVVKRHYGYMFNMMIIERERLKEYCTWLFDILFELKKRVDVSNLSAFQGRFYGRISEIIFNVWLDYQLQTGKIIDSEIKEIRCIHMEKINWGKKSIAFLKAKFFNQKYEASF